MGKKKKPAKPADDNFEDMLDEFKAQDLATASTITPSRSSSGSSSGSSGAAPRRPIEVEEETIIVACANGELTRLRRWASLKVRTGVAVLCVACRYANVDVVRCVVQDMGADVNQAKEGSGVTPMLVAAQYDQVDVLKCLKELGGDVKKMCRGEHGCTPL
jgi:hypothetical protein